MNFIEYLFASFIILIASDSIYLTLYFIIITTLSSLLNAIVVCYQTAVCNVKTCRVLEERVHSTSASVKLLRGYIEKRERRDRIYLDAFQKFVYVLEEIKMSLEDISKIHRFKTFTKAISIKERLIRLTGNYEAVLNDLQFTFALANEERRRTDSDNLNEDLTYVNKIFIEVNAKVDEISRQIMQNIKTNIRDLVAEEWIKMKIKEKDINYFEYSEFRKIEKIGEGGFGIVNKAETSDEKQVALKCLFEKKSSEINEKIVENFIKELKTLREVNYHDNIISFLGISKDIGYIMVLEYANEGNLRNYLAKKFKSLEWEKKFQMALDITCGLKCLHSREIIHRDLHSKNILVNNGKLLIADFGLSKQLTEVTSNSTSNRMGVIEYIEPLCLKNEHYVKDKRSDVYSLGVLLWEITSGYPPFQNIEERDTLGYHIGHMNRREEPIEGTPLEYQQLYQRCWDDDPVKRPDINQVYDEINEILRQYNANGYNEQEDSLAASASNRDRLSSLYQSDQSGGDSGLCISDSWIDSRNKSVILNIN